MVRSGHVAQFGVDGDTGPGFMGLLVYEFTVYWFIGLWVYGVTAPSIHWFTVERVYRLMDLRVYGFIALHSVHAVVISHHVAAERGTPSGLCEALNKDFCRSALRC